MRGICPLAVLTALLVLAAQSLGADEPKGNDWAEWSPGAEAAMPSSFRGCLHNKTYSPVTLTIARPNGATVFTLRGGEHCRVYLYKGEAVFIAGDPRVGKITAYKQYDVAGETTVTISPNDITFQRGVQECLKQDEENKK